MAALAEELSCIICMSLFREPCTLPCGHTFCTGCLETYWAPGGARACRCPLCQRSYSPKPELCKNTVLAGLLERLPPRDCPACAEGRPGGWLCLSCGLSCCTRHLGPHRHQLLRPPGALRAWPCREHHRALELYCPAHGLPVCPGCARQQHGGCQTLPLQRRLREVLDNRDIRMISIDTDIKRKEEAILKRKHESIDIQESVSKIKNSLSSDFSAMKKYIEQQERAMLERIEHEEQVAEHKIQDSISSLTKELAKQKEIKTCLEQPLEENWLELLKDTPSTKEIDSASSLPLEDITLDSEAIASLTAAVVEVKKRFWENAMFENIILPVKPDKERGLIGPDLQADSVASEEQATEHGRIDPDLQAEGVASGEQDNVDVPQSPVISSLPVASLDCPADNWSNRFSQCAVDVTFDPQTVSCYLGLAEENRKVIVLDKKQSYTPLPTRFINSQLLCSQGFSTGCNYWEISTKDCDGWAIGIANKKIGKKDGLGRTNISWCLEWSTRKLSAWHNNLETPISQQNPQTVGVFLDCEMNMLSFFSVADELILLHTYKHSFPYPVFPAFWLYGLQNGNLAINVIKKELDCSSSGMVESQS